MNDSNHITRFDGRDGYVFAVEQEWKFMNKKYHKLEFVMTDGNRNFNMKIIKTMKTLSRPGIVNYNSTLDFYTEERGSFYTCHNTLKRVNNTLILEDYDLPCTNMKLMI